MFFFKGLSYFTSRIEIRNCWLSHLVLISSVLTGTGLHRTSNAHKTEVILVEGVLKALASKQGHPAMAGLTASPDPASPGLGELRLPSQLTASYRLSGSPSVFSGETAQAFSCQGGRFLQRKKVRNTCSLESLSPPRKDRGSGFSQSLYSEGTVSQQYQPSALLYVPAFNFQIPATCFHR